MSHVMNRNGLALKVLQTPAELPSLQDPWNQLVERSLENIPFLTYDWLSAWWRAFAGDRQMHLVTAWRNGGLCGLAPLVYTTKKRFGRRRQILSLWANEHTNRTNFVIAKEGADEVVSAMLEHLLSDAPRWDLLELGNLDAGSAATGMLLETLRAKNVAFGTEESIRSPYLTLPSNVDEVMAGLSSSFRQTLRRKVRKAKKAGDITVEAVGSAARLEDVLAISRDTWQHGDGTSIASTETLKRFYSELAANMAEHGWLQLAFLRRAGKSICFEYNLVYNNKLYNLKLGYRPELGRISPGLVLKYHLLEQLMGTGVREYDFLGADEHYKLQWSKTVRQHCKVLVFNKRPDLYAIHFALYRARPFLRRHAPVLIRFKKRFGL